MFSIVRRILHERADYGNTRSWLFNLYSRILRRFPRLPLPGRGKIIHLSLPNALRPVSVRLATSDIFVANEIFSHHEYDFVARRLPSLDTIVDLGANIGLSMRYWREKYPSSLIIGVEPDRSNATLCHINAQSHPNPLAKTFVIRACAGGTSRMVTLNRSHDAWGFQIGVEIRDPSVDPDLVPVFTIPQILSRSRSTLPIQLLKCDIEGGEEELFQNCASWIAGVHNLVVEVHPPYSMDILLQSLRRNGADFELVETVDKGGGLFLGFLTSRNPNPAPSLPSHAQTALTSSPISG